MISLRKGFGKIILIRLLGNPKWHLLTPNQINIHDQNHHCVLKSQATRQQLLSSELVLALLLCHLLNTVRNISSDKQMPKVAF